MTSTIQRRGRPYKGAAFLACALLSCAYAAFAQNLPQRPFPAGKAAQKRSFAFQNYLKQRTVPLAPNLDFAQPLVHRMHITDAAVPNDTFLSYPNYINNQAPFEWGPFTTRTVAAWHIWQPKNTRPIIIAIIDTGVDDTHPDLTNMILRDATGNVIGYNSLTQTVGPTLPDHPHGTHCAGIAAAQGNNGLGVAGVASWNGDPNASDTTHVKIMPVKVLDASGSGTDQDVADGIDWAVAHGANVISISLGDTEKSDPIALSIAKAWDADCLIVCAAGNEGNTNYFYPAASPYSISVAATGFDMMDSLPFWSTRGPWVTLSAPGYDIYSTYPGGSYVYSSGTSMSCPYVAGLAALAWAQNPTLKNSDIYNVLVSGVDPYPAASDPIAPGSGRINSYTTLNLVNAAMGTARGSVTLEGCVNANQKISLRFRSSDGLLDFTCPAALTGSVGADAGTFSVSNIPAATYVVSVKGEKWLQKNVTVTVAGSPAAAASLTVSLPAGDANNDNSVDSSDFGILIGAFNSASRIPSSGYDASADFNCDGLVDTTDFGILIGNFNQQGDL